MVASDPFLAPPRSFASLALLACLAATGCVWTSDGGITERVVADEDHVVVADHAFDGGALVIRNNFGDVRVRGVVGAERLRVRARFIAGANNSDDANAAFADLADRLVVEETEGQWQVYCQQAAQTHGSVVPNATGCERLVVEVPAGEGVEPLALTVLGDMGGAHIQGVEVQELKVSVPFGVIADVTPTDGATIDLEGENLVMGRCDTVLRVPRDTGFSTAALSVQYPDAGLASEDHRFGVRIEGFADAPPLAPRTGFTTWNRPGAIEVEATLRASLGRAILTSGPAPSADQISYCDTLEVEL
ncbi:MAG: hypothetical protein AAGA56_17575 [Myxococcota bacterium]